MLEGRSVDIIVPVFNNAGTLKALSERCHAEVSALGCDCRMVFIDDASRDQSAQVLDDVVAEFPRTIVIGLPTNRGQQNAIKLGLREVRDLGVVMDADLQDPPEAIGAMLEHLVEGQHDVVFGTRRGQYQSMDRMLSSRLYRRMLRIIVALPSGAGGFLVLKAPVASALAAFGGSHFYLVGLIGCGRYSTGELPVHRSERGDASPSQYSFSSRFALAMRNLNTVLKERLRDARY